jgi:hypothetical protein
MLSNSQDLFLLMSKAFYRAGLFVSYADLQDGKKAGLQEMKALGVVLQILQDQGTEGSFLKEIAKLASGEFNDIDQFNLLSDEDIKSMQGNLQSVPQEVASAVSMALDNFSKAEARLYADMLLSVAASVAQAHDERDDMFLTHNYIVDKVTFLGNARQLFYRFLMRFSSIHAPENARYLYEQDDIFDELKISTKETDALGVLSSVIRQEWLKKYPDDANQTVQDYIKESRQ